MSIKIPDADGQTELSIHGGARKGAGRKKLSDGFENRKVSLSLPIDRWDLIDKIKQLDEKTRSDVLAELIMKGLELKLIELMDNDGTIKWKE